MCKKSQKNYLAAKSLERFRYCILHTIQYDRLSTNSKRKKRKTHFLEDDDAFPPAATEALLRRFFPAIIYLQQHTQTLAMRMEEWNSLVDNVFSLWRASPNYFLL
jgi:hypothetical protein